MVEYRNGSFETDARLQAIKFIEMAFYWQSMHQGIEVFDVMKMFDCKDEVIDGIYEYMMTTCGGLFGSMSFVSAPLTYTMVMKKLIDFGVISNGWDAVLWTRDNLLADDNFPGTDGNEDLIHWIHWGCVQAALSIGKSMGNDLIIRFLQTLSAKCVMNEGGIAYRLASLYSHLPRKNYGGKDFLEIPIISLLVEATNPEDFDEEVRGSLTPFILEQLYLDTFSLPCLVG